MIIFQTLLAVLTFVVVVLVVSVSPRRSRYSTFELSRRTNVGDSAVDLEVRREAAYEDIVSIQRVLQAVLLVIFVVCVIAAFGWFFGIITAIAASLIYGKMAAAKVVHRRSQQLYDRYEAAILAFVERYRDYLSWVRTITPTNASPKLASREELRELVVQSAGVVTPDEAALITASLDFDDKLVSDIMTPKSVVDTISRTEILGPLVLDDLHKTGHSRFPVIDGDIDHIVGMLYLRDVLTLDGSKKHTSKVESAMSKHVFYIRQDHTLSQALKAFLKTHHHLFVVINEYRETVGIVTLEDTIEALLGKRILDEFDAHDDMRAVAERNASSSKAPNRSAGSTDV
jgi:CBS domain containing-hemolysin-like protein